MFHVAGGILLFLLIIMCLPFIEKVVILVLRAIPFILIILALLVLVTRS